MKKINKTEVKRILVITLSNMGDIILTTPVVEVLLKEFPAARLDVMVGPSGGDIFRAHPRVSECIIYNKRVTLLEKFKLFLSLRKKGYDLVVDLRNTILPIVIGSKYKTNPFRHHKKEEFHKKDVHLSRLKEIGIDISNGHFYIPIEEKDKKNVENLLGEVKDKPFIVVSPGAKSHVKRWPLKNFAKLCDMIKEKIGYDVVLTGDAFDRVVTQRILSRLNSKVINLAEKTNIRELACLIKKSKLLITNDSAPMHAASAVNAPTLAFFGPTNEKKYGPLADAKKIVMRKNIKCTPCCVPQCINFDNKYECLKTITPEEAFEAVKELLKLSS